MDYEETESEGMDSDEMAFENMADRPTAFTDVEIEAMTHIGMLINLAKTSKEQGELEVSIRSLVFTFSFTHIIIKMTFSSMNCVRCLVLVTNRWIFRSHLHFWI